MSARRLSLLALLALLGGATACSKTSARPGPRLSGPSAVAVYRGLTTRDATALRHYLAVSNERGDDLRLIDAIDGQPVLAPGLVMSLSVSTVARPAFLVAGGLNDAAGPAADLLALAPAGLATCDPALPDRLVSCLQVVDTWTAQTTLARQLTLVVDDLPGGTDGAFLSLVAMPVPEDLGGGAWGAAAGRVRVAAGLSGGRLLLADFARAADGVAIELVAAAVHDLGFEAVSLSASPDLHHLYAASPDLMGVAELEVGGAVTVPPPSVLLPAGAPTTHVLAAKVRPAVSLVAGGLPDHFDAEVVRVYAALDPGHCNREWPVTCGLAVLDPAAGAQLPDPAGQLPAHLPIAIPGTVVGMVAVYPPTVGGVLLDGTTAPDGVPGELQKQANLTGTQNVSTLAAVASSDGTVVLVDLARGALAREHEVLATTFNSSPTRVASVQSSSPEVVGAPRLALWNLPGETTLLTTDVSTMIKSVVITPGFAPNDTWDLSWEGLLPGLGLVTGQAQSRSDHTGLEWLAVQSSAGLTATDGPYRGVGRLYDPRSLVRPGDIVRVTPQDTVRCPRGFFEVSVTGVLAPTTQYPGGAVSVTPRPLALQPTVQVGTELLPADPTCLDGADRSDVRLTFRAGGLILLGIKGFGYAGRPELQASDAPPGFSLAYLPPSDPALACPLLDDPAFLDGTTWPPPTTCDQDCRDHCERLLLARKARRQFYMADQCATLDVTCRDRWQALDPVLYPTGLEPIVNPTGPVLAFKVGQLWPGTDTSVPLERDARLTIITASGQTVPTYRPLSGSTAIAAELPTGMTTFDRAGASGKAADGVRVFTGYTGNLVLDLSPSLGQTVVTVHR